MSSTMQGWVISGMFFIMTFAALVLALWPMPTNRKR